MDASVSRWSVDVARFAVKTSNKNNVVSKVGEFVLRAVMVAARKSNSRLYTYSENDPLCHS